MVKVNVKPDCGNALKKLFLRDYHIALANHDLPVILDSVADDIQWEIMGERTLKGKAKFEGALEDKQDKKLESMTIDNIITHGNAASVNGTLIDVKGVSYGFCDVYTFTSSAKNAKIKSIISYLIKSADH
jgi:SnoaL-like protein